MLCLTRRPGQKIIITNTDTGKKIEIIIIYTKGKYTKLGIEADKEYTIHREEIQERVDSEV